MGRRLPSISKPSPPPSGLDLVIPAELVFIAQWLALVAALALIVVGAVRRRSSRGRANATPKQLAAMLRGVELLNALGDPEIEAAVSVLEEKTFKAGDVIYRQDDQGNDCFFMVAGECYAEQQLHTFEVGTRVAHKRHGVGTVAEVTKEPSITRVVFDAGESHRYGPASLHKLKPVATVEPKVVEVMQYRPGGHSFFGERALSRIEPRPATIICRTDATVLRLTAATFLRLKQRMDDKENLLRKTSFFETFGEEQIAALASVLELHEFAADEALIRQGEHGTNLFVLEQGECVATIHQGSDAQEVRRYGPCEVFGEKALLERTARAATITANGPGIVWTVSREDFEAKLGPLSMLQAELYLTDPRSLIANFYGKGDATGPAGALPTAADGERATPPAADGSATSAWFAVYRPCSRDSIAKMLGRVGTGKGLNIKGKSAKKNRLSGFVPFVQISDNDDKEVLEPSPRDSRVTIFYQSEGARATACAKLGSALVEMQVEMHACTYIRMRMDVRTAHAHGHAHAHAQVEKGSKLNIADQAVRLVGKYEPATYGLDVPEELMMEVYIMRADVSPVVGWETGRGSEPAFLDMNRHALRGEGGSPTVVLHQFDKGDPLNPLGLLMAYAEANVTPVVSDFDTFLIGSRGLRYDATPPEQVRALDLRPLRSPPAPPYHGCLPTPYLVGPDPWEPP